MAFLLSGKVNKLAHPTMRGFIDNLSIILSDVDMGNLYPDVMKYPFPVSFSVPPNWYWSFI